MNLKSPVVDNVLSLIGNTPMVRIHAINTGPCELYVKLENQNPGGSIEDRMALTMIEAAERKGLLKPAERLSRRRQAIRAGSCARGVAKRLQAHPGDPR